MINEKYLFFRSQANEDNIVGDQVLVPVSNITGIWPDDEVTVRILFKSVRNYSASGHLTGSGVVNNDYVDLTITQAKHANVINSIIEAINGTDNFIVIADDVTTFTDESTRLDGVYINKNITACNVVVASENTTDNTVKSQKRTQYTAAENGTSNWYSYGLGFKGSGGVLPTYSQETNGSLTTNNEVVSIVNIDLHGLTAEDNVDTDVIGLDGTDGAYFAKYVSAEMGTIYKIEVLCTELPAGTNDDLLDIDIVSESVADGAYSDDASGWTQVAPMGGNTSLYKLHTFNPIGQPTANDYFYLKNGVADGSGNAATVFSSGKFTIKFYGIL